MADHPLTGAVALVTGASSGIGAATAIRLAKEGAAVALVARRRERLEDVASDISSQGGVAVVVQADITQPELAEQAVTRTLERLGRLDVLVNGAEIMLLGTALHATLKDWDQMTALNVAGTLHVTHEAVPYLIDAATTSPRRVADIVNISSTAGRVARAGSSVYNFTKFGLNAFSEALRQELLAEGVRVAVVASGLVETELVQQMGEAVEGWYPSRSHMDLLRPHDVADAICYVVTRERRVAVNEILVRGGNQFL